MRGSSLKRILGAVLTSLLVSLGASSASATVILWVDITDIEAVKFIPTGANSDADSNMFAMNQGVTLLFFLQTVDGGGSDLNGNLKPPGTASSYTGALVLMDEEGLDTQNLTLLAQNLEFQEFSTEAPAFTGMGVADLSEYSEDLPFVGYSGDIVPGNTTEGIGGVTLGQYQVVSTTPVPVPLPASALLVSSAIGGLAIGRYAKRRTNPAI